MATVVGPSKLFDSAVDMDSKSKVNTGCDISDIETSQLSIKSNATMVKCHHENIDHEKNGKQPRSLQVKAVRLDHTVPTVG